MKHRAALFALASTVGGALVAGPADAATYSDSLTSPSASAVSVMQSALTAAGAVSDQRNDSVQPAIVATKQASWGNASRFAAAYETQATSLVNNAGVSEAYMAFDSQASAFSETQEAVLGVMYDITNGPGKTANVYAQLYLGGNQIRSSSLAGGLYPNPKGLTSLSQVLWTTGNNGKPLPVISLGPIAIVAAATLSAYASQVVQGHVWYDGTSATFTQNAGITASASAGIGALGAYATIGLNNVRLIDAGETLSSTALINPCNSITLGENASLFLRELGGDLTVNLSFPWVGSWTDNITHWPGLQQTTTLVNAPAATRAFSTPCFAVPPPPAPPPGS